MVIKKKSIYTYRKNSKKSNKTFYYSIVAFIILFVLSSILFGISAKKKLSYKYIYSGVYVDSFDVSGLTKEQALKKLQFEFNKKYHIKTITLVYDDVFP